jgi:CubicO group peptidase (beta-lactamase class C family)
MNDGWEIAAPDAVGLNADALCKMGRRLAAWTAADVHAVLVIRHSKLVYERYFTGTDTPLSAAPRTVTFNADTPHDLRSIEKGVLSLLVGVLVGQGKIASVDQPVLPQLPAYADLRTPQKDQITLRHLLTMSPGLAWNEDLPIFDPSNNETLMYLSADPARYALAQPVEAPPGLHYTYNTGAVVIIGALLQQLTGEAIDALARRELFAPLGITDVEWARLPSDVPSPYGLRMRPRDLGKLGQLVLNRGAWGGRQIVPAEWVAAATSPQINGQQLYFYGYLFWLGRSFAHGQEIDWIAGVGLGGQRLYIVPSLDLVVLVHAGLYQSPQQAVAPLVILNSVLRAVEKR